jgi:hypothetical protein
MTISMIFGEESPGGDSNTRSSLPGATQMTPWPHRKSPEVNVMIPIIGDFHLFSAKKWRFSYNQCDDKTFVQLKLFFAIFVAIFF